MWLHLPFLRVKTLPSESSLEALLEWQLRRILPLSHELQASTRLQVEGPRQLRSSTLHFGAREAAISAGEGAGEERLPLREVLAPHPELHGEVTSAAERRN